MFLTDAPDTFRSWFRQRRMWWSGSFRMAFVNADQTARYPITFAYTACAVWLLLIGKWGELANIRSAAHVLPFLVLSPWRRGLDACERAPSLRPLPASSRPPGGARPAELAFDPHRSGHQPKSWRCGRGR